MSTRRNSGVSEKVLVESVLTPVRRSGRQTKRKLTKAESSEQWEITPTESQNTPKERTLQKIPMSPQKSPLKSAPTSDPLSPSPAKQSRKTAVAFVMKTPAGPGGRVTLQTPVMKPSTLRSQKPDNSPVAENIASPTLKTIPKNLQEIVITPKVTRTTPRANVPAKVTVVKAFGQTIETKVAKQTTGSHKVAGQITVSQATKQNTSPIIIKPSLGLYNIKQSTQVQRVKQSTASVRAKQPIDPDDAKESTDSNRAKQNNVSPSTKATETKGKIHIPVVSAGVDQPTQATTLKDNVDVTVSISESRTKKTGGTIVKAVRVSPRKLGLTEQAEDKTKDQSGKEGPSKPNANVEETAVNLNNPPKSPRLSARIQALKGGNPAELIQKENSPDFIPVREFARQTFSEKEQIPIEYSAPMTVSVGSVPELIEVTKVMSESTVFQEPLTREPGIQVVRPRRKRVASELLHAAEIAHGLLDNQYKPAPDQVPETAPPTVTPSPQIILSPDIPAPNVKAPSNPASNFVAPSVSAPKFIAPNVAAAKAPKIAAPKVPSPNVATPKLPAPNVAAPNVSSPQIATSNVAAPKVPAANVASPKVAAPNIASPNFASPNVPAPKVPTQSDAVPKVAASKVPAPASDQNTTRILQPSKDVKSQKSKPVNDDKSSTSTITKPVKSENDTDITISTENNAFLLEASKHKVASEKQEDPIFEGVTAIVKASFIANEQVKEFILYRLPMLAGVSAVISPSSHFLLHGSWLSVIRARKMLDQYLTARERPASEQHVNKDSRQSPPPPQPVNESDSPLSIAKDSSCGKEDFSVQITNGREDNQCQDEGQCEDASNMENEEVVVMAPDDPISVASHVLVETENSLGTSASEDFMEDDSFPAEEEYEGHALGDNVGRIQGLDRTKMTGSVELYKDSKRGALFLCSMCGFAGNDQKSVQAHIKRKHKEKDFKCKFCPKEFAYKRELERHLHNVHVQESKYACDLCSKEFTDKRYLSTHLKRHTGVKNHQCNLCGRKFFERHKLKWHFETHKSPADKNLPYACTICYKKFYNRSSLADHQNIHTGARPFECTKCDASFSHRIGLKRHLLVHTEEKMFTCEDCGKAFKTEKQCDMHMVQHTGVSKHMCEGCYRVFSTQFSLKRHMSVCEKIIAINQMEENLAANSIKENIAQAAAESDNTVFMCGICDRLFSSLEETAAHTRTHTSSDVALHATSDQSVDSEAYTITFQDSQSDQAQESYVYVSGDSPGTSEDTAVKLLNAMTTSEEYVIQDGSCQMDDTQLVANTLADLSSALAQAQN